ncbi:MAG: hydrogenase maturation protease [Planctomycetota bacterium]
MEHESILVIGYGNELRGDDGVGPRSAALIDELHLVDVRVIAAHQLTPELSAQLANARCVLFLDADPTVSQVQCERIDGRDYFGMNESALFGHSVGAPSLLALTKALFGVEPSAWLIHLPAPCTAVSDRLSPVAEKGVEECVRRVREWVESSRNRISGESAIADVFALPPEAWEPIPCMKQV